jgi:hypothetical protein
MAGGALVHAGLIPPFDSTKDGFSNFVKSKVILTYFE